MKRRGHSRAQALVEFALLLPVQLMLLLGAFTVYQVLSVREDLKRAASEGAIAGASQASQPNRCPIAIAAGTEVFGHTPNASGCTTTSQVVELSFGYDVPIAIPFFPANHWTVDVSERAEIR